MTPNDIAAKQFAVNWNNHMNHVRKAFDTLLSNCELTDVILYAEGQKIGAHKMLLSACSSYFRNLFREFPQERPIIVLKGVSYAVLTDILKFIYNGEVSVDSEMFDSFLQTAEFLQISGLTDGNAKDETNSRRTPLNENFEHFKSSPKAKRKRNSRANATSRATKLEENHTSGNYEAADSEVLTTFFDEHSSVDTSNFTSDVVLETVENDDQTEEQYNDSASSASDNPLKCPICFKVFSHPYSLHHHKPVHLGSTKCPICHVVLSRKYNLKMHMRSRHNIA